LTLVIFIAGVFYYLYNRKPEGGKMRTALNLLNKIVDLGYDQQKTLIRIDKILDKKLGIESRKPLFDEELPDIIYNDILGFFQEEARKNQDA
jgi:hypothetical protein